MKLDYSVTFEFATRPPETHRGVVEGGAPATCASRAVRMAGKAVRPRQWTSVVCLLLTPEKAASSGADV